ncbi:MAG TPA: hypothetical protein VKP65_18780 [Rhodothermales bacterium]|nr:hypothetical protein [Rhodothermales bacterium]
MKHPILLLLAGVLLWSACSDAAPPISPPAVRVTDNTQQLDSLRDRNAALTQELRLRTEFLESYTRIVNETLGQLEAISEREGLLRQIRLEMDGTESPATLQTATIQSRIQDNLAAIEHYIAESKRQQAALEEMTASPEADVSGLQSTIRTLSTLVREKERTIVAMREEAKRMLDRIASLGKANTRLVAENTELREAYFVVGTRDKLMADNIIDRSGGFLSIGRKTHLSELDARHFQTTTVETRTVPIGQNLTDYKILSPHQQREDLFSFDNRDGTIHLAIHNADAFWKLSRYLVIEIKR